jgi:hypothetical protein
MRFLKPLLLTTALVTLYPCFAMQLGAAKSTVVFGRVLDISIPVRLDTLQDDAANCFSAEVFQADNKFDAGRVRIDVSPSSNGQDAVLRLRSVTTITEPWAKVILHTSCGAKVTRQYDFLTEFSADSPADNVSPSSIASMTGATSMTKTATQVPITNDSVKRNQASAQTKKPSATVSQVPKFAAKKVISSLQAATEIGKTASVLATPLASQPRLKMETVELTDERQVLLKLSSALTSPTGTRTPEEVKALAQASAVWRVMNDLPLEAKAPTMPVVVENPAKSPTAVVTTTTAVPSLIDQKLAEKSEFSNLIVYGLVGLLAITLGCITWLWLRVRKASRASYDWLNNNGTDDFDGAPARTQFLPTTFHESEYTAQEQVEPALDTEAEAKSEAESDLEPRTKAHEQTETTAQYQDIAQDVAQDIPIARDESKLEKPTHVDNPKFDGSKFDGSKFDGSKLDSSQPVTARTPFAELEDIVLAKAPAKLHAVTAPVPAKEDAKSNMIDFEIFADSQLTGKAAKPKR